MRPYVQLIYNPMAGARIFPSKLDYFTEIFQKKGYEVRIKRTESKDDLKDFFVGRSMAHCSAVIVAGGDGSINQLVNAMFEHHLDIPIGVLPAGTANDFAGHLGISLNLSEAIVQLSEFKQKKIDIGRVNNQYFVNVCCGGLFTNISQNIDIELKNTLGKLAYYLKGVQQLPKFRGLRFKIDNGDQIIEDSYYFFLLLNGSSAGGFNRIAKNATLDDGYMDFVGIKECPINYMPTLFRKIITGEHLEDKYVTFFQGKKMNITCLNEMDDFKESDVDGEKGPDFPLNIEILKRKLKVLV